ncbi:MAG: Arm DNA-binding domain-containing protein, partial [Bacteroidota bacterium]
MMNDYPIYFECKIKKDRQQEDLPMYFRVYIDGKNNYLNINRKIPVDLYDSRNKTVKKQGRGWKRFVDHIDREKAHLVKLWDELLKAGHRVTYSLLKEHYDGNLEVKSVEQIQAEEKVEGVLFSAYAETVLQADLKARGKDPNEGIGEKTAYKQRLEIDRVERYHPGFLLTDFSEEWLNGYFDWAREQGALKKVRDGFKSDKMTSGAIFNCEKFVRKVIIRAYNDGYFFKNP